MKNKNLVQYGTIRDYYWPSYQYISGSPGNTYAGKEIVTSSAVVHGNHHDPNSWSYEINDDWTYYGQLIIYNGPSNYWHTWIGYFDPSWGNEIPNWDRTLMYNRALERLNSKVRGNLDLSIDLAEAGTTGRMIRGLGEVFKFAKGRRWSTKDLANGWLQFQYGWKPLLADIFDICDEENRIIRRALTKVKASATQPFRVSRWSTTYVKSQGPAPVLVKGDGKQSCRMSLELEARDGWDPGQWSSLNPVSIGWELIPYSFVVDWFVDVGSFLRNLESALLYNTYFKSGYVSELFAYDGRQTVSNNANGWMKGSGMWWETSYRAVNVNSRTRQRRFYRTKLTSYPFPRAPTFKVDLGSQRLFSAASLLRQLLK